MHVQNQFHTLAQNRIVWRKFNALSEKNSNQNFKSEYAHVHSMSLTTKIHEILLSGPMGISNVDQGFFPVQMGFKFQKN